MPNSIPVYHKRAMNKNQSTLLKWSALILIPVAIVQMTNHCQSDSTQTEQPNVEVSASQNTKLYKFNLTECLGKELLKPATFIADANSTSWLLDFNNGSTITYTIISGNEYDPMCGLKAKDNLGDMCEICIKKNEGDNTTITFNYSGKKLIYKGDYVR